MVAVDENSDFLPCAVGLVLWAERLDSGDHASTVFARPVRFMSRQEPEKSSAHPKKTDGGADVDQG